MNIEATTAAPAPWSSSLSTGATVVLFASAMEAILIILIILFGELTVVLVTCLNSLISLVGSLAVFLLPPLSSLVNHRGKNTSSSDREAESRELQTKPVSPKNRKWIRWLGLVMLVFFAMIVLLNFLAFEPIARFALRTCLKKQGIEFSAEFLKGNLFTGKLETKNLALSSKDWSVNCDRFDAKFSVLSGLSSHKEFNRVLVHGFRGTATIPLTESKPITSRRKTHFGISNLEIKDAAMECVYTDGSIPPISEVKINSLTSSYFQSRYALFYLFPIQYRRDYQWESIDCFSH